MRASISFFLPPPSTINVLSLSIVTRLALPSCSSSTLSSFRPMSSLMNVPPVSVAMSPIKALRRSPKPGALTAQMFSTPRSLFTTSAAKASLSTSSAMISSGRPPVTTLLSSGSSSARLPIFFSWIRM